MDIVGDDVDIVGAAVPKKNNKIRIIKSYCMPEKCGLVRNVVVNLLIS